MSCYSDHVSFDRFVKRLLTLLSSLLIWMYIYARYCSALLLPCTYFTCRSGPSIRSSSPTILPPSSGELAGYILITRPGEAAFTYIHHCRPEDTDSSGDVQKPPSARCGGIMLWDSGPLKFKMNKEATHLHASTLLGPGFLDFE